MLECTRRLKKTEEGLRKIKKAKESSRRLQKVQEGLIRFKKVPKGSRRLKEGSTEGSRINGANRF